MDFIDNYMIYASGNEAPRIYHLWGAIASLSSAISRRVVLDQGIFQIHPNMYIVLVGSPGCGKTTAMSISKNIIRDVKDISICADSITKEALIRNMSKEAAESKKMFKLPDGKILEYNHLSIFASELVHFLGANAIAMVDFLTNIFDEAVYENKTKNKGEDDIKGPYITMLGCMTPEITTSFLKQSIITGGFTRRAVFVMANGRGEPVAFPEITREQYEARQRCIKWLQDLKQVGGHFTWTPECREKYEKWYVHLRKDPTRMSDPTTMGYFESKHVQALKVGMLISLARSHDLVLQWDHVELALVLLGDTEKNLSQVFLGVGRNDIAQLCASTAAYIKQVAVPMPRKRIYDVMFNSAPKGRDDIDKALFQLIDTGKIAQVDFKDYRTGANFQLIGTIEGMAAFKISWDLEAAEYKRKKDDLN